MGRNRAKLCDCLFCLRRVRALAIGRVRGKKQAPLRDSFNIGRLGTEHSQPGNDPHPLYEMLHTTTTTVDPPADPFSAAGHSFVAQSWLRVVGLACGRRQLALLEACESKFYFYAGFLPSRQHGRPRVIACRVHRPTPRHHVVGGTGACFFGRRWSCGDHEVPYFFLT